MGAKTDCPMSNSLAAAKKEEQIITPPTPAIISWVDEVEVADLDESAMLSKQMAELIEDQSVMIPESAENQSAMIFESIEAESSLVSGST